MEPFERLEEQLSESEGGYAVVVNSGTAALHLALESLQLPLGSEVLVPEFTMVACARAVTLAGLKPVFVDCRDDLLMDRVDALAKLSDKSRAVMPVHIYGRKVDDNTLIDLLTRADLYVVEDRAEAHGIKYTSHPDAACYSFYRNKIVAGEEGGAIVFSNNDALAYQARSLRSLGASDANDFLHTPRGMNYRMSNKQAQIISYSLGQIRGNIAQRRKVERIYEELLPDEWKMPRRDVPWVYDLRIKGMDFDKQNYLVKNLRLLGIEARHAFKPMSMQPEYRREGYEKLNAYRLAQEVIYLPLHPLLTETEVRKGAHELKRLAKEIGL